MSWRGTFSKQSLKFPDEVLLMVKYDTVQANQPKWKNLTRFFSKIKLEKKLREQKTSLKSFAKTGPKK